jgi:hypothetical protein
MKNTMLLGFLSAVICAQANADDDSYAIAAYSATTSETVYVYGPLPTNCDAARLDAIRKVQQTIVPPSLVEIGYACASRAQIASLNLNPPICELANSDTYTSGSGWAYVCYRGIVDRFVKNYAKPSPAQPPVAIAAPSPVAPVEHAQTTPQVTAAELEQQRKAQEATQAAQQQAAELAAKRAAQRAAWQRYAVSWVYQRDKAICLQKLNARRLPGQDDPGPLCDRSARNSSANPAMDVAQYCRYLRSTNQPESTIHAACDTTS